MAWKKLSLGVPLFILLRSGTDSEWKERSTGRLRFIASFSGPFLGMEKINFSGGEPFLQDRGEFVGKLVQFCKRDLKLPSVSIVSNGSLIRERWFKMYGKEKLLCREALAGFGSSSGFESSFGQPHQKMGFDASERWFSSFIVNGLVHV